MTDTPPTAAYPPVPLIERLKAIVGDLARPFAIYAVGAANFYCICFRPAAEIFAAGATLGVLYVGKAYEVSQQAKQTANVEVAKVAPGATV